MAITIGTNAYITAAEYEAYADERGVLPNAVTLDADIIKSADFIDTYYNFRGEVVTEGQPMKLPTDQVTIANIKKAALKAVEMQQAGLLTLNLAGVETGLVKRVMEKVDVLETETEYVEGSQQTFKRRSPELDMLLRPYTIGGTNGGLVRV